MTAISPVTERRLLTRLYRYIELEEMAPEYYGPKISKICRFLEI